MQAVVHIAKILPPQIPPILPRPRLLKSLEQHQDKKLTLILGQAAQGKSTLAASYVETSPVPSAWINLSPEDTDAVNLFYLLGHALQRALPEVDFSPALSYPAVALGPREEGPLYRDWLLALLDRLPGPVQIILDGLDRLAPGASSFRFLQILLDLLPPHLRLFILSREMPPVDIQQLADSEEVFRLGNADLAFNLAETTKYFHAIRKFSLSPDLVQRIHQLTEGWIGGLVLFCDSLDWVPESQRERYVSQELAGKFIWNIFQYFGERIFSLVPREVQEFLIKSSILEVVEPDFVGEAMGLANPQAILEELVKRNLFVQSIYDKQKGWSYRYHPLFREFLQGKFQSLMAQEHQTESYYQAAALSEHRDDLVTAVRFYLRAQAFPEAAAAVAKVGWELVRTGKTGELAQWLAALPPELVQKSPWLLFYFFISQRFTGTQEATVSLEKAYALFAQEEDVCGVLLSLAHLLELSVIGGQSSFPLLSLAEQSERLLASPSSEGYPYERAVLWFQLGFAHFMRSGEPHKGYLACQNAYMLARSLGDISLQLNALLHAHANLACMGEFSKALQLSQKVDQLLGKYPYPGPQALHFLHLGILYLMRGDLDEASGMIQQAHDLTEKHGLLNLYLMVLLQDLVLTYLSGNYREAEGIGTHLLSLTKSMGNMFFHGMVASALGSSFYHAGDYRRARKLLDQAQHVLTSEEGLGLLHLRTGKIVSNLISYHCQDREGDEEELQELLNYFVSVPMPYFVMAAHLALALVTWQKGQAREAARHLAQGFKIAEEKEYYYHMNLTPADLLQASLLALELEVVEVWDYVARLLTTRLADQAPSELAKLAQHANHKVADQAWEIRKAIHRSELHRLRVQTLGGFRLWRGEGLVEEKDWQGNQPQVLLKAIITHGPQAIPKDVLMEDLWPEASPNLAERNFKINLHRLRRTLEPILDQNFGSSYIHLKANLVFLDAELCHVDIYEFVSLSKKGERQEEEGNLKAAISLYKQAVEFYAGDFLPEELYHPWVEEKREELRQRFLEVLYRLAKLYEAGGSLLKAIDCYKMVVQTDPLAEPAYQRLVVLLAQRGMRNAALRVYQDCRQALRAALDTEPEAATTAIYRKIVES